jgi:integrase
MGNGVSVDAKDQPIDEVKVGSVAISIYLSPVTVKVKPKVAKSGGAETPSATEPASKTYESYLIPHYEGSERVVTRRSTIGDARKYAKEVAKGTPLVYSTVAHKFLQLRQGIRFNGRAPRLHDFRHTLACRVLQRWQAHGKDPSRRIAVLARFLGHAHVTDTYWYFSAFPQLLADATRNLELD